VFVVQGIGSGSPKRFARNDRREQLSSEIVLLVKHYA
jgi:hypothetical protein